MGQGGVDVGCPLGELSNGSGLSGLGGASPVHPIVSAAAVLCVSDQATAHKPHIKGQSWTCWPWDCWGHPQQSTLIARPWCLGSLQLSTIACCSKIAVVWRSGMSAAPSIAPAASISRHSGEQGSLCPWHCRPGQCWSRCAAHPLCNGGAVRGALCPALCDQAGSGLVCYVSLCLAVAEQQEGT